MPDGGTLRNYMQTFAAEVLDGKRFKFAVLAISSKCPSCCPKCYQGAGPSGKIRSVEESLSIVDSLHEQGFTVMTEMMELVPETIPLLEVYQRAGSRQISTSGELLVKYPDIFDSLRKRGIDEIRITLEHPSVHYKWCRRKRSTAEQAIVKSIEEGFRVVVNSIVSKSTVHHLDEICKRGEELGVHQIHLLNYIFENRAKCMPQEVLDQKDIEYFHKKYVELRREYRKKGIVIDRAGNFGPNPDPKSLSSQLSAKGLACWAGKGKFGEQYFIDINNNIYPCMLLRGKEMVVGKLVGGRVEIHRNPMQHWHRRTCYSLRRQLDALGK